MFSAQRAVELTQKSRRTYVWEKINKSATKGGYAAEPIHKNWFFPALETELRNNGFTIDKVIYKPRWFISWKPNDNGQCI
jgi:hypothetical protein